MAGVEKDQAGPALLQREQVREARRAHFGRAAIARAEDQPTVIEAVPREMEDMRSTCAFAAEDQIVPEAVVVDLDVEGVAVLFDDRISNRFELGLAEKSPVTSVRLELHPDQQYVQPAFGVPLLALPFVRHPDEGEVGVHTQRVTFARCRELPGKPASSSGTESSILRRSSESVLVNERKKASASSFSSQLPSRRPASSAPRSSRDSTILCQIRSDRSSSGGGALGDRPTPFAERPVLDPPFVIRMLSVGTDCKILPAGVSEPSLERRYTARFML